MGIRGKILSSWRVQRKVLRTGLAEWIKWRLAYRKRKAVLSRERPTPPLPPASLLPALA